MNIDTISNICFYLILSLEIFFAYKYMMYWLKILTILKNEKGGSPIHSQKELNEVGMSGDFKRGYGMIFSNMAVSARIMFSSNTDNPEISALAKRVRRTVLLAVLTPMIIMFVLIFATALMQ